MKGIEIRYREVQEQICQNRGGAAARVLHFVSAELCQASFNVLLRRIERLAAEFRDVAELDRALPPKDKRSVAMLLAVRPWVFSMFEQLRQPAAPPP